MQHVKKISSAIPEGSSLEELWGPCLTWSDLWKNRLVDQKQKSVVIAAVAAVVLRSISLTWMTDFSNLISDIISN